MSVRSVSRSLKKMSRETVAVYVLLAVLLVLVVYFVMKNREGFNSNSQPVVIYFFYVDWCPHCTRAKPAVEEVQQQYANNNAVEVRAINCEAPENKELVQQNNVSAYPTVKADNSNEMESAVTAENLVAFIEQQLNQ
jgi:thiol-disulfide isomerase/thioredoxin